MRARHTALLTIVAFSVGLIAFVASPSAQSKPVPGFADYGKWESLGSVGGGGGRGGGGGASGLSNDGKWLGYIINQSNRDSELRLVNLATNAVTTDKFGSSLSFADDSKWAAWSVGYSEAEQERMRTQQRPIQNRLAIMNLATGDKSTVDAIQSFAFSADGNFLLMRRYAPAAPGAAAATPAPAAGRGGRGAGGGGTAPAADDPDPTGVTVTVRNLSTGGDLTFGNVGEPAWQDSGATLAMTISAAEHAGNGVQVYDAAAGTVRVLESGTAQFLGLAWRRDSADLLVMRAKTDDKKEGSTYLTLAWTGVGTKSEKRLTYDPTADAKFPAGMRVVSFRRASWSEDGRTVQVGIAKWEDRPAPAPGAGRGTRGGGEDEAAAAGGEAAGRGGRGTAAEPPAEMADVTIWHWKDAQVASVQKLAATADRRRSLPALWHTDTGAFTQIGRDFLETVQIIPKTNWALVQEWGKYAMPRSIGRPATDLALADLTTGARTPLKTNLAGNPQVSPGGKYLLFLENGAWWTLNLQTKAVANLSKAAPATSFIDKESDSTASQKPSFGVAGWTKDDGAVLLNDKYDIWSITPDGAKATRLTSGAGDRVRHRYVRVDTSNPTDLSIDLSKPVYVSLTGDWSKKSGYGVLKPGATAVERILFDDKAIDRLGKARNADVFIHGEQTYADSPNLFVSQGGLSAGTQVTHTNAFQKDYAWGKSEIIEYMAEKTAGNRKMQGALYYPAGYEPGKRYPMIVYMYELLSDGVHRYVAPSDTSYYNTSVFTTHGYFVLQPDIVFRPREPGLSVVECVRPAVAAAIAKGLVDPTRVGIIGHSWGGFDTAFLATHTQGTFAAAVAGAAITDLISNYGNGHWSSGILETDHIETGQQRMEVPFYDDLQAYIRNSAVFNAQNMSVPTLIEVGNVDGTVWWHQGLELYSLGRRAGKNVVMIEYANEDHGLSQRKNQTDYQRRILEWFGHYLKGEPAKAWITDGQTVIDRQDEVRKAGGGSGASAGGGRGAGLSAIQSQGPAGPESQLKAFSAHKAMAEASPYKALPWQWIGPTNNTGRMTSIAVADDSGKRTIYVGAASGGVWKSEDRGDSWQPIFEHEATASIGDVAVAPSNHNILWVGTGEDNLFRAGIEGTGMYKSTDAGKTWQQMGLSDSGTIGRILVHPTNPNIVFVAAQGHEWTPNEMRGVYKTTDGGNTWVKSFYRSPNTGAVDLVMDPADPNTLYAAMNQRMRRKWTDPRVEPGNDEGGIWKTTDGGKTWKAANEGLTPAQFRGRVGVDIARSNPNVLYAIVDSYDQGLPAKVNPDGSMETDAYNRPLPKGSYIIRGLEVFRSDNKGQSWKKVSGQTPEAAANMMRHREHLQLGVHPDSRRYQE